MQLQDSLKTSPVMNHDHLTKHSGWLLNLALLLILSIVSLPLSAAVITVQIDRNPVHVSETVEITFTADSAPDGDPDFSPLQTDFEILNQSSSSQVSIMNGQVSRNYQWIVTVMPKQAGGLIIPSIAFGSDRSPATVLQVTTALPQTSTNPSKNVFLEVDVSPANPYVQAQVIYTIRVYHRTSITQAELSEPEVGNAVVEQLGKDTKYRTQRGNITYDVYERRYAIFPQRSGKLHIAPIRLDAQILTGQRSRGFFFSRDITHTERITSDALELDVKPIPHAFTGQHWLPASSLELTQTWSDDPSKAVVGEPETQTLTLRAEGLMKSQLPSLSEFQKDILASHNIKIYPDQPVLTQAGTASGVMSQREEKIAMIPEQPGAIKIPAVEIPWWNTQTDHMEIARIEEIQMYAKASSAYVPDQTPVTSQQPVESTIEKHTSTLLDISDGKQNNEQFWKWLALALGAGWLLTTLILISMLRAQKKRETNQQQTDNAIKTTNQRNRAGQQLRLACRNNHATEAKTALLNWAQNRWPDNPPTNLAEIGKRVPALHNPIEQLQQSLYKSSATEWDGNAFWEQFKSHCRDRSEQQAPDGTKLEPLFKT